MRKNPDSIGLSRVGCEALTSPVPGIDIRKPADEAGFFIASNGISNGGG